ncbi:MAG: TIGR03905 family TSCPD domain-containing protein [Fusobacteriaceae bacterium]|jgi:uncharacterized protein (TIGR03905 family)|nr:TIGR03905 family TSCPD domain-containing protein [Fusobacteriaceae bacterium]
MKKFYKTEGTCCKEIGVDLDAQGRVAEVEFVGGCDGNTHGIENLVKGMSAEEIISRLRGIECGKKGTSCPDQLSKILELAEKEI